MASHDSDSSDDDMMYTTTDVLLGYASKEPTEDAVSQLGGQASWLEASSPPSSDYARCKVCNDMMVLLLQLHGDLPEHFPGHERRLHVFACKRRTCKRKEGSVRGLRSTRVTLSAQKVEKKALPAKIEQSVPPKNLGNDIFGTTNASSSFGSANPFSTSSNKPNSSPANPFSTSSASKLSPAEPIIQPAQESDSLPATFAEKARISAEPTISPAPTPQPWPTTLPTPYPAYYLDAAYETLDDDDPATAPGASDAFASSQAADVENGGSSSTDRPSRDEPDTFESSIDKTFQRFADRLSQNPLQVLRYEFRGSPLLYSKTDAVGTRLAGPQHASSSSQNKIAIAARGSTSGGSNIPACGNCGAGRVFELQLVPHAIAELEADEAGLDGMEWGTLILGVCGRDCEAKGVQKGGVGYVDEWVGVQWEEMGIK